VALTGIAFAVILIMMQIGFRSALIESAVRYHERFRYDVALFSHDSQFIVRPQSFSDRRLYQALAVDGVRSVSPVYIYQSVWKNPDTHGSHSIFTVGVDPEEDVLDAPGVAEGRSAIRRRDVVLFDAESRPEHGPIAARFAAGEPVVAEVNDRRIEIGGLFRMGTSFGIDAGILTSSSNFLRLFPSRSRHQIDLGLIQIDDGVEPSVVRDRVRALVPDDVLVMTRADFVARETAYWNSATPIGYVFAFGAIMGFVVGAIIVYQILFADVSEHLREYATLRALGYSNRHISGLVVQQALILALLGFVPGVLVSWQLYQVTQTATRIPMTLSPERMVTVLALTIAMCVLSGVFALRRVRTLDPAEVF
jgi:putative ABC transport system permease protein